MRRFLLIVLCILLSILYNDLFFDRVLAFFSILSPFAYLSSRVAFTLFLFLVLDCVLLRHLLSTHGLINRLFFIYAIWFLGLLFGRHVEKANESHFNFISFLPDWIHHIQHPLVMAYLFGNLLAYIPFGMYLRVYLSTFKSVLLFIFCILLIEWLQGVTKLGYFDVDDLILNGISGMMGIIAINLYKIIHD